MATHTDLLVNNSILYRSTQKYYDARLTDFGVGYGQVIPLMMVNENEGITMKELSTMGSFDKGTITKTMARLEKQGYIRMADNPNDRRSKLLYTTEEAKDLITALYIIRKDWMAQLTRGLKVADTDQFIEIMRTASQNALDYAATEEKSLHFYGLQKMTLLDFPGKVGCTLFTGGCNLKCPFCQNSDLVFLPETTMEIDIDDIRAFLQKRRGLLEGVCISGGEPLIHSGLFDFMREVKDMGYDVKLDTNGTLPDRLERAISEGLVDYVAMDVKNAPERYGETVGMRDYDLTNVTKSRDLLLRGDVDYEFRTTIVKEFHDKDSVEKMAAWLEGAKALCLQNFEDGEKVIRPGLHSVEPEDMKAFKAIVEQHGISCGLRGIDDE